MSASKRGGARKGSGRPPALTDSQWVQLGDAIERRLVRKLNAMHRAEVMAALGDNLRSLFCRWWVTLPADRSEVKAKTIDLHSNEIQVEIDDRRHYPAPTTLPAGIKGPVIGSVARALARRWKVGISVRTAERCWAWHQKVMPRLRKGGEDDYVPKPGKETEAGDV